MQSWAKPHLCSEDRRRSLPVADASEEDQHRLCFVSPKSIFNDNTSFLQASQEQRNCCSRVTYCRSIELQKDLFQESRNTVDMIEDDDEREAREAQKQEKALRKLSKLAAALKMDVLDLQAMDLNAKAARHDLNMSSGAKDITWRRRCRSVADFSSISTKILSQRNNEDRSREDGHSFLLSKTYRKRKYLKFRFAGALQHLTGACTFPNFHLDANRRTSFALGARRCSRRGCSTLER